MIKYRTGYAAQIVRIEAERETESSVWIKGSRSAKRSSYENYWDSWQEAHGFIMKKAERDVQCIRMRLEQAKGSLGNIKGMREPV